MVRARRSSLRPFTPSRERPEALTERTVGRRGLLDTVHRRLVAAATSKNRSHTLIVGARGAGKTHVLDVALHRLRGDALLTDRLVVGRVDEDAVGIVTYSDLLLHVLAALAPPTDAATETEARRDVGAIEAALLDHLDGRVLVAVIENLSRVFDNLGTAGQQHLRSFVETTGQVVILASTPLLVAAIGSRNEPWFGSFAIEHLPELALDEGAELLRGLAVQDGDARLVRFLDEPKGRARLAALHHLAGGSPRLWMILAGCATVELLDDLVPAVEELLENLVAYYQQRLWELPGNEQKLVRELGIGPTSATVGVLAARCGLDARTAATALGRLSETGWVRAEKLPGADRRQTWYRLREPLLRHHFQYRRPDGEPLQLIVEILRVWFDPIERRAHLAGVAPASVAERHLLATLRLDQPQRSDSAYAARDVVRLLGEVRCWINDPGTIGTRDAGMLLEAAVTAVTTSPATARSVLDDRRAPASVRERAENLFALAEAQPSDLTLEDRVGALLDAAAAASATTPDHPVLELLAACWNGFSAPASAVERLEALVALRCGESVSLTIRDEHGFWLGEAGRHAEAVIVLAAVVEDRVRVLGPDHPDTRTSCHLLASALMMTGRQDEAIAHAAAVERAVARHGQENETTRRTMGVLIALVIQLLSAGKSLPPREVFGTAASSQAVGLLRDMEAARDGSAAALARLPSEVRPIVETMAAATSSPTAGSGGGSASG